MKVPTGLRKSMPFALATIPVGIAFGVLAAPELGAFFTIAMSAIVWAGGAQFAAVSILSSGGALLPAAVAGIVANARYLPMGFAVAPSMSGPLHRRMFQAATLTDASFVIGREPDGKFDLDTIAWAAPLQYLAWVGGTVIGAIGAHALPDPDALGLDVVYPVFFLSLLIPELRNRVNDPASRGWDRRRLAVVLLTGATAASTTPVAPAGIPIVAGSVVAFVGLAWRAPRRIEEGRSS